jgi:hypothetical protein
MKQKASLQPGTTLSIRNASFRIARRRISIGSASVQFVGRRNRSVRFTFVAKDAMASSETGVIELELSRAQALTLGEWISEEAIRRVPAPPGR